MPLQRKIVLFYTFLLLNYLFHTVELYPGILRPIFRAGSSLFLFLAFLYVLFYLLLLYVGWMLVSHRPAGYRLARAVSVGFLSYGLVLAVASVYRNGQVPGNFSGFLFVMICLPLILQISDYRKRQEPPASSPATETAPPKSGPDGR